MKKTAFGWKRKAGAIISQSASLQFQESTADDSGSVPDGVDWPTGFKRRRNLFLEDCAQKGERLREEGVTLAESERYWQAIKKFNEALELTPTDAKLWDMKAQALMLLREDFEAVKAAETAVKHDPTWWAAHQTLGRSRLALGEISMALRSFSTAVHLNPSSDELRQDDLLHTLRLLRCKEAASTATKDEHSTQLLFDEDGNLVQLDEGRTSAANLVQCRELS
ncbi:tetratricopeptide repeat protein 33-like [Ornithodoros turicata]|uniref:tetratricopeptide repeat protein 33-like n=1 Tax=Ornithodoros turicata TaxID=34597 RepID=UPI0031394E02